MYFDPINLLLIGVMITLLVMTCEDGASMSLKLIFWCMFVIGGVFLIAGVCLSSQYITEGRVCDKITTQYTQIQIDNTIYYVDKETYAGVCKGDYIEAQVTDAWMNGKTAKLLSAPHVGCCKGVCE